MIYIIPTEYEIQALNKLYMSLDNTEMHLEYMLEKMRMGVNEYMLVDGIMNMFGDLMLDRTHDPDMYNKLMTEWLKLVIKIHYYIVTADMQLPITEFKLQRNDICVLTEG